MTDHQGGSMRRRGRRFAALTTALTAVTVLAGGAIAWADSTGSNLPQKGVDKLTHGEIGLNLLWIVIGAVLVIFMQAGFALVETGFCRAKHAAHVVSTNFAIFGLGFVAFFICGYAFMFGGYKAPGLFGAWTWGGGWLSQLGNSLHLGFGYADFAGSGVVHAMGGAAALAGAMVLGPRIGKYGRDGKPRTLSAHHIPMAMLGTFILLFGWFGFNAASTLAGTDFRFAVVATNTAIAAAFGATIAMLWVMLRAGKPDPGMMANGMLAGLVAITAPCAFVQPWAAALIGSVAAVLVVESVWFFERKAKIDDPVGAISVHGVCGIFGVLSVGVFADGAYGAGWNLTTGKAGGVTGLFYGDPGQLAAQAIGGGTICFIMFGTALAFFTD